MTDFNYYGLFLIEESKTILEDHIRSCKYHEILEELYDSADHKYMDHVTLLHHTQAEWKELRGELNKRIGKFFNVTIKAIGFNNKALAFMVSLPSVYKYIEDEGLVEMGLCANDIPHITIATYDDGKPVDSNTITEWKYIKPITVLSILKKV